MCTTRPGSADNDDERGSHHEDGSSACPALSLPGDPVPVPHLGSQPQLQPQLLPPPSPPLRQKTSGPAKPDSQPAQHRPQTRGRGPKPNPTAQAGLRAPSQPGGTLYPPGPSEPQPHSGCWGRPQPGPAAPLLSPCALPSLSGAALGQRGPRAQGSPRSEPSHKYIAVKPASSVTEVFVIRCLPARSPREGRWPGAPSGDIFIPLVVLKHHGKKKSSFHFFPSRGCPQEPGSARRNGIGAEREGGAVRWAGESFGRRTAGPLPGSALLRAASPWQRGLLTRPNAAFPPGSAMRVWGRALRAAGSLRWAAARPGASRAAHCGQSERPQGRRAKLPAGPDLRHFLRGAVAPPPAREPELEPEPEAGRGSTSGLGKGRCAPVLAQPSLAQLRALLELTVPAGEAARGCGGLGSEWFW